MKSSEIKIETDYIKLDSLLKFSGAAQTGSDAKEIIREGKVLLNSEVCLMRGRKVRRGDRVCIPEEETELIII